MDRIQNWVTIVATSMAMVIPLPPLSTPEPSDAKLTPAQLAGQRIIYSYSGYTPPQSLIDHIKAGEAAGVIFFAENVQSSEQLAKVSAQLQDAAKSSPVASPLLLMTDQEGGQIRRVPGGPEMSAKQVGASADPSAAATKTGTEAGQALTAAGVNVNLAPVLGVHRKSGDFLDRYGRSYSTDPAQVGSLAAKFTAAQQAKGVLATAKHFPGLGAASSSANTDETSVTLDVPASTLRSVDEAPYPTLIKQGVPLIMPSWAIYTSLDPKKPAGLSTKIMKDELRDRLKFGGVTVSDAMEAGALKPFGDIGKRSTLAASAGMDLLLCSARDASQGESAAAALAAGLQNGSLPKDEFTAAAQRVTDLRASLKG